MGGGQSHEGHVLPIRVNVRYNLASRPGVPEPSKWFEHELGSPDNGELREFLGHWKQQQVTELKIVFLMNDILNAVYESDIRNIPRGMLDATCSLTKRDGVFVKAEIGHGLVFDQGGRKAFNCYVRDGLAFLGLSWDDLYYKTQRLFPELKPEGAKFKDETPNPPGPMWNPAAGSNSRQVQFHK